MSAGAGFDRREVLGAFLGGAVWAATGCSPSEPGSGSERPPRAPEGVPAIGTMMGWIEDIVAQGIRRPGYPADTWTEGFVADRFRDMGLDVHTEPVHVTRWAVHNWSLTVLPPDGNVPFELDCTPLPYAAPTPPQGIELDLVRHDPAAPAAPVADLAGRAALVDARLVRLAPDAVAGLGSVPDDLTSRVYDPDGTFADAGTEHLLPHTAERNRIADIVFEAGAAAFVGTLVDHPADSHRYFVPYHGEALPGPGVWISGTDGRRLHDLLERGPVRVRLVVESTSEPHQSHTIVGELPGPRYGPGGDGDLVLVGSHHDGPWASAVEDGTGIALVLAQAAHWASVPRQARPHRLRFILQAGHMCGGAGHDAYVREHADELDQIVLAIHLEHAALDTVERNGAQIALAGRCVPRWFFTSRIPDLEATVMSAIADADLRRSMLVAPDALGANPPTDGGHFHLLGVPLVQFLSAPWYLFDAADTLDKVDRAALLPLTHAVIDIITSTTSISAHQMRSTLPSG